MPFGLKKLLDARQTRMMDINFINKSAISSIELMEKAALAFVNALDIDTFRNNRIIIVCGVGNNGGDGFAISRILHAKAILNTPVLIKFRDELSPDCSSNMNRVGNVLAVESINDIPDFSQYDIIIDAVIGSGLTRPVEGIIAKVIDSINQSCKRVYSVDIPSGLMADEFTPSCSIIISDLTVTFQRPKLSFFQAESNPYIRSWAVVDIGLDEDFIQLQDSNYYLIDNKISESVRIRKRESHKGNFGHAFLISGSYNKMGAATLCAKACLRSGVGLLTVHLPKCGHVIMQVSLPEAMCSVDSNSHFIESIPDLYDYKAIGIGPGIGKKQQTIKALQSVLTKFKKPIVIDADALNLLAENNYLLKMIPANSVLTPHPKEFERLVGSWSSSVECLKKLKQFANDYKCIVVLKGTNTSIVNQEGLVFYNTSGNPGMATAGSGDVLTGIITGLLSQGYAPLKAAIIAVYYHGLAGDVSADLKGENAMLASDIINSLRIER